MFGCGLMIGAMIGFFVTLWIAAEADDENKKEIKYLRRELARQTKEETTYFGGINDEYKRNH